MKDSKLRVVLSFVILMALTVFSSLLITTYFGAHSEKEMEKKVLVISDEMKVTEIAQKNEIKVELVKEAFKIKTVEDESKTIKALGISQKDAVESVTKQVNYAAEEASKNPVLIGSKFAIWIIVMVIAFKLLRKNKVTPGNRKIMLFMSMLTTGIILGSEPNSMSTVKDMISAYAIKGIFFPPRMIAMLVFLLMVFLANKFICGWACQFGTLQDLIFRINRDEGDKKGIFKQYKVPFVVSNTIRIMFFTAFTVIAFMWAMDIIEPINPFNIYKPASLSITAILLISSALISSLFVYRPWCHFFCPFGLAGWIVEKLSWFKIKVNYSTCTNCGECSKACPTNVMDAILKQDKKTIPDCFSCGTCINACPTKSISFDKGQRMEAPKKKFYKSSKV